MIIRPPNWQDVCELVALMRPQDVDELYTMSGITPKHAVPRSLTVSDIKYAMRINLANCQVDGPLLCLFGASKKGADKGTASIWLLGTSAIDRHPKEFMRACRPALARIMADMPDVDLFFNFIPETNARSFRWLEALGAKFSDPWTREDGVVIRGFHITRKKALNV